MKKFLKSLMTITMILIFAITLTGCDKEEKNNSGNDKQDSKEELHGNSKGTNDLKNVSNSNYEDVAKSVYGIETKDATGWTVKTAESLNGVNDLVINYTITDGEDAKAIIEHYFDQCKSVSKDGVYEVKTNYETYSTSKGEKYDTFESYFASVTKIGSLYQAKWIYDNNGKNVQFIMSINETYATITLTLLG